jgi:hypothetical protein
MATSEKKIAANRLNGKKGGPKTKAGKIRSSSNALKVGNFSQSPVVRTIIYQESEEEYNALLRRYELDFPGDEAILVQSRKDLAWADVMIARLRKSYKSALEKQLKLPEVLLKSDLQEKEEERWRIDALIAECKDWIAKLDQWPIQLTPWLIRPEEQTAILNGAREYYKKMYRYKNVAPRLITPRMRDLEDSLPEPIPANLKQVASHFLEINKEMLISGEDWAKEWAEDIARPLEEQVGPALQLILPEADEDRFHEYLTYWERYKDRTLARIILIEQRRVHILALPE